MKNILLLLTFVIYTSSFATDRNYLIYKFDIKEDIQNSTARTTEKAVDRAKKLNADYIIVHMNTFGGEVASADKIRTKLLNSPIPTVVLIDNNAASAGALISLACDSIYMVDGANIGAASVVNQMGEKMPEKYQSYMRSIMRSTAESHGMDSTLNEKGEKIGVWRRNPDIAEAMVDESVNRTDSSKIVTFTTSEAIENGFSEGKSQSVDDVIQNHLNIKNYKIVEHKLTSLDRIINFLINPAVSGVLIMVIIGGIYYEIRTPGIGVPIAASIIAAVLFFMPLYLEDLAANWEIACFVVGVTLLIFEIFVIPGFGLAGISGIFLVFVSFIFSLVDNFAFDKFGFDMNIFSDSLFLLFISLSITLGLLIFIGTRFIKTKMFQSIALTDEQKVEDGFVAFENKELPTETAETITPLEPIGKIRLKGKTVPAKALNGYIEKDKQVKIIGYSLGEYEVEEIK